MKLGTGVNELRSAETCGFIAQGLRVRIIKARSVRKTTDMTSLKSTHKEITGLSST